MLTIDQRNAENRKRSIERSAATCIHWRPVSLFPGKPPGDDTCLAGVDYREAFGRERGIINRLPCCPPIREMSQETKPCPVGKFEAIGLDQATHDYNDRMRHAEESLKHSIEAIRIIDSTGTGVRSGRIDCPVCGGTLMYSVASNEHRMAQCRTKDCVSFIE